MKSINQSKDDEKIAREKWLEARLRRIWQNRKNLQPSSNDKNQLAQRSEMPIRYISEAI